MSAAKSVPISPLQEIWFKTRRATRQLKEHVFGENPREPRVLQYILKNTSPGDPQAVLDAMDHFGRYDQFLMNVGDEKGLILDDAVRQSKAGRALELGCYCGYSAVRIGRLLQESSGTLISIEKSADYAAIARHILHHAGLSNVVEVRVGEAADVVPTLTGQLDLVFIDHAKESYLPDLETVEAYDLLRPGSYVVADNVGIFVETLQPYLDYVRTCGHYESRHFETMLEYSTTVKDGVEVSIRKERG